MTNNYSREISMKPSHPDSGSRLKALVAATPVLGVAARSLARIPVVKVSSCGIALDSGAPRLIGRSATGRVVPRVQALSGASQNSRRKP